MTQLPAVLSACEPRPFMGDSKVVHYVPTAAGRKCWDEVARALAPLARCPVEAPVCPQFGQFGLRLHPYKLTPYFHAGVDMMAAHGTLVRPMFEGSLVGSGDRPIMGRYVYLKHPFWTEDGLQLHSLYLHLDQALVGYSLPMKVLRRLGPERMLSTAVDHDTVVGRVGDTGYSRAGVDHLHVQLELRVPGERRIVLVDPRPPLGLETSENGTARLQGPADMDAFWRGHRSALQPWRRALEAGYERIDRPIPDQT